MRSFTRSTKGPKRPGQCELRRFGPALFRATSSLLRPATQRGDGRDPRPPLWSFGASGENWLSFLGPARGIERTATELNWKLSWKRASTSRVSAPGRRDSARVAITGVICGVRVETIEEPLMREIRTLDKLVDELARGKWMEKILRG